VTAEDDPSNYLLLTDILGMEDHYGDMDFKVNVARCARCAPPAAPSFPFCLPLNSLTVRLAGRGHHGWHHRHPARHEAAGWHSVGHSPLGYRPREGGSTPHSVRDEQRVACAAAAAEGPHAARG